MKKNNFSLFLLLVLSVPSVHAQVLRQPIAAVYLGLNAYSTEHTDVFAFTHNQAALAEAKKNTMCTVSQLLFQPVKEISASH
jgi:hypothetical protein